MRHDTCTEHERLAKVAIYRYFELGWYMLRTVGQEIFVRDKKGICEIETDTRVIDAVKITVRAGKFLWAGWEECASPAEYYALKGKLLDESEHDPIFVSLFREFETKLIQQFVEDKDRFARAFRFFRIAPSLAKLALMNIESIVRFAQEEFRKHAGRITEDEFGARYIVVKVSAKHPDAETFLEFLYPLVDTGIRVEVVPSDETIAPLRFLLFHNENPTRLLNRLPRIWERHRPTDLLDTLFHLIKLATIDPHSVKIEWWVRE